MILIALTLLVSCTLEPATQPAPATNPALWRRLEQLDQKVAQITDLVADFQQEKFTALLKKPLVSTGSVRVKGAAMRWDTRHPEATTMSIDEKEVRLYYPGESLLEIYPIDRGLSSLAASPLPRLEQLSRFFAFEEIDPSKLPDPQSPRASTLAVRLTPIDPKLAEHVQEVRVLLDEQRGFIMLAEMVDVDGDRTIIRFGNFRPNTNLRGDDLRIDVPANTKISRPMDVMKR